MPILCEAFVYRSLMYMRCFVSKRHISSYRAVLYNRGSKCAFVVVSISCLLFGCCGSIFLYRVFEQLMLDEDSYKKHYYNYS